MKGNTTRDESFFEWLRRNIPEERKGELVKRLQDRLQMERLSTFHRNLQNLLDRYPNDRFRPESPLVVHIHQIQMQSQAPKQALLLELSANALEFSKRAIESSLQEDLVSLSSQAEQRYPWNIYLLLVLFHKEKGTYPPLLWAIDVGTLKGCLRDLDQTWGQEQWAAFELYCAESDHIGTVSKGYRVYDFLVKG